MKTTEIRALRTEEIQAKLDETHKAIFNLGFQAASGQLEDFNRVTALRRDVARMKTILRERELAAQATAGDGSRVAQGEEK
jgi:large subunit ribosomal protein L29